MEGTVIMAETQLAGRGQTDNSWHSEGGLNLTFSILLSPVFLAVEKQFALNKAISIALNDVLRKYVGDLAAIKWPNDSYIGNKKTGGLLIENLVSGNHIRHAIVGIGLNVNQTEFPDSVKNATSLKKALHKDYDLDVLLGEICSAIEARYLQLKAGAFSKLHEDYLKSLYLLNEWALYKFRGSIHSGRITGINHWGQLELETMDGILLFNNKEIEFINE